MKQLFLLCWVVLLSLNTALAATRTAPTRPPGYSLSTGLTTPNGLSISVSPQSATYTVGQSVTVSITGGTVNTAYVLGYEDANLGPSGVSSTGDDGTPTNSLTWTAGQTSRTFTVLIDQVLAASDGWRFIIYNDDYSQSAYSQYFETVCPTVSIAALPSLTIGTGQSVTLTATSSGSATSGSFYTWNTNQQANPITFSPTSTTTYSVTGTTNTGGCSATVSVQVSVTTVADPCAFVPQAITVALGGSPYEGVYTPDGSANGAPKWSKDDGRNSILFRPGSGWVLYDSEGSDISTNSGGSAMFMPCTGWSNEGIGVPTFSGGCGALVYSPVTITASPGNTITSGGSVTLTASGATSYTWSNGVQSSSLVLTNVTSATTFSVTGITGSCSRTASAAVQLLPCDQSIIAHAYSLTQTAVLGSANCAVQLTGMGYGTGYTITGPGGYVFSAVYRVVGAYTIRGLEVKLPGTYTLRVSYSNACGQVSSESITYVVTGTACK